MSEKHEITKEMVDSFQQMILSKDEGDITLALDILENRDKEERCKIRRVANKN
jgi:hypothetical protein